MNCFSRHGIGARGVLTASGFFSPTGKSVQQVFIDVFQNLYFCNLIDCSNYLSVLCKSRFKLNLLNFNFYFIFSIGFHFVVKPDSNCFFHFSNWVSIHFQFLLKPRSNFLYIYFFDFFTRFPIFIYTPPTSSPQTIFRSFKYVLLCINILNVLSWTDEEQS